MLRNKVLLKNEDKGGSILISSVYTFGVNGIQANVITCECLVTNGLPAFEIVGLPDAAVKEARERVRGASKTCGFRFPTSRITVNLSPANLKKSGSHYDLPILMGLLEATGMVSKQEAKTAFIGELSLDGKIRPVPGVLPMALAAKANGFDRLYVPAENAAEATLAKGPAVYPVKNINELVSALNGEVEIQTQPLWVPEKSKTEFLDFKDVMGQESVKRALEIAAAGSHNILMIGPPGSGKSMLSKRIPSILPNLTTEEALEVSQIYSVMGLLTSDKPLVTERPFRAPHHTISNAGLAGGGSNPRPGEISLAHKGVLFLDEFPEFRKDTLELMRQPLEDGVVTLSRASGSVTFPAEHMLVCAMNPCRCGWYGDPRGRCKCSQYAVDSYRARISGPMLDRIDIVVEVPAVAFDDLQARKEAEPSSEVKKRVNKARQCQISRYGASGMCNARMGPKELREFCKLDDDTTFMLRHAFNHLGMTARSYDRIIKVSRTIADLAGSENITMEHVAEAIQYRRVKVGNQ